MIALLALLIVVSFAGLGAAWLGEHPGSVKMLWFGYQIETSVAVLALIALLLALGVTIFYHLLRRIMLAPTLYSQRRSLKHYRIGLDEITHSVAALAANDMQQAIRHTKKAERALGQTPLTILLRAQISKSEGSDEQTRALLEKLLDHPQTEYLAAKSLSDAAQKQQKPVQALALAERAHKVNPKEGQGAWSLFHLHLDAQRFTEAGSHALCARKSKAFSRDDYVKAKGLCALRQAQSLNAKGQKDAALLLAREAAKLLGPDVQAAELYAALLCETGQDKAARAVIQKQWKHQPSAKLAELFNTLMDEQKPTKREKLVERLCKANEAAAENQLLD